MTPDEAVLTHATTRGIRYLSHGDPVPMTADFPPGQPACGAMGFVVLVFPEALRTTIPTCAKCAVLRDAALESSEATR